MPHLPSQFEGNNAGIATVACMIEVEPYPCVGDARDVNCQNCTPASQKVLHKDHLANVPSHIGSFVFQDGHDKSHSNSTNR